MKAIIASLMLLLPFSAKAQELTITGKIKGTVPTGMRIFLMPIGGNMSKNDTLAYGKGRYTAHCQKTSEYGLYSLISIYNQRQNIVPVRLTDSSKPLALRVDTMGVSVDKPDNDNKALATFNNGYVNLSKQLWIQGKEMTNAQLKSNVLGCESLADSVIKAMRPSDVVAQYLRMWASIQTYSSLSGLKFATGHAPSELGLDTKSEAKRLLPLLDNDMSSIFSNAHDVAIATLSGKSLAERLEAMSGNVKNERLAARSRRSLLDRWASSFDYQNHFDEGLEELRKLTAQYNLDSKYIADFEAKRATIKGTPFPSNAKLLDADGNEVSFNTFKGKVVYVDMWASWCVPCIKEIPHLKQLEKEFEGKNIAFVSISIDAAPNAWKQKMKQLDLHGNQLINSDNSLGKSLNVRSIPRFLIYGADGNLIDNNAPRPSDTRIRPMLEKLCK